jgi:hypothetical protein
MLCLNQQAVGQSSTTSLSVIDSINVS